MSSTIRMNMTLLGASGIVPASTMKEVFLSCVKEMNGEIINSTITMDGKNLGRLSLGERIVLQYESENTNSQKREELRGLFSRRVQVAQINYLQTLENQRARLEKNEAADRELHRQIEELDRKERKSQEAMQRQEKPACVAIKEELCVAAEEKGFDVIEEETDQGVELQFIKRIY